MNFDRAVHQRLLESMKSQQSVIKFTVEETYDEGEGDYIITAKLCGDWPKEDIQLMNEMMDYIEEFGVDRQYYKVQAIHFTEAERETATVTGNLVQWMIDLSYTIEVPAYQALVNKMKAKGLRVLFRVAGDGFEHHSEYTMYSDGEQIEFERTEE